MTRPFEFLDSTKYPVHEYLSDTYFMPDGRPNEYWMPPDSAGSYTMERTWGNGRRFIFEEGTFTLIPSFGVIIDIEHSERLAIRKEDNFQYVHGENCSYNADRDGKISTKKYTTNNYTFYQKDVGKHKYRWVYNDMSSTSIHLRNGKYLLHHNVDVYTLLMELSNKKGRVSETAIIMRFEDDGDYIEECTAVLRYNRMGNIEFSFSDPESMVDTVIVLPNMPSVCISHLWNDVYMFEALINLDGDRSDWFEQMKNEYEKRLDVSISSGYYVPYSKGLKHLIDAQKVGNF